MTSFAAPENENHWRPVALGTDRADALADLSSVLQSLPDRQCRGIDRIWDTRMGLLTAAPGLSIPALPAGMTATPRGEQAYGVSASLRQPFHAA
jgi:hypothetical protein